MKKLVVVGTGLFAELSAFYFEQFTEYKVVAFASDPEYIKESTINGKPVVTFNDIQQTYPPDSHDMFIGVGYVKVNKSRARMFNAAKEMGYKLPSFVHPNVKLWENNRIGENVFIFEDNTIQPFVTIGDDTILWSGNHIGHHTKVGSHVFIASHAVISGNCVIGDFCFVGVNATFRDSINVAESNVIGAGAIIMGNTQPKQVFIAPKTEVYSKTSDQIRL